MSSDEDPQARRNALPAPSSHASSGDSIPPRWRQSGAAPRQTSAQSLSMTPCTVATSGRSASDVTLVTMLGDLANGPTAGAEDRGAALIRDGGTLGS